MSLYKSYEVDEMCTYYKKKSKLLWIVYALRKDTRKVVDFAVGPRTKLTLQKVTDTLVMSESNKVYTDKLNLYGYIIPADIHCTAQYSINHIERKNLSLRTHIKRLNRRTICFSKSIAMLSACLKIYFGAGNENPLYLYFEEMKSIVFFKSCSKKFDNSPLLSTIGIFTQFDYGLLNF